MLYQQPTHLCLTTVTYQINSISITCTIEDLERPLAEEKTVKNKTKQKKKPFCSQEVCHLPKHKSSVKDLRLLHQTHCGCLLNFKYVQYNKKSDLV